MSGSPDEDLAASALPGLADVAGRSPWSRLGWSLDSFDDHADLARDPTDESPDALAARRAT
jgi:hypothetical protein